MSEQLSERIARELHDLGVLLDYDARFLRRKAAEEPCLRAAGECPVTEPDHSFWCASCIARQMGDPDTFDGVTEIIARHLPASQSREVWDETELAAAWDKAFEGTIVPKSDWPTDPDKLKALGLHEYPAYFDLFMKALKTKRDALPPSDAQPPDAQCECGHLKSRHRVYEDHDECIDCNGPNDPCSDFVTAQPVAGEAELSERKAHRELCSVCGEVSRVMFSVPNEVWKLAVHQSQLQDIICLRCFTRLADERGVEWDKEITFQPVSRIALDRIATESGHPEDFCKKCGRANVVWFAPNELWNKYVRDNDEPGILCPVCFVEIAERHGLAQTTWQVAPRDIPTAPTETQEFAAPEGDR